MAVALPAVWRDNSRLSNSSQNAKERTIYTLYWDRGGANMASHAILEELGVPYEMVEIDLAKQMQRSAEYLAINPNGKVPTLRHQGQIVYESAAILTYLLDQHPDSDLAPATNSPLRGRYYQTLFWLSGTVQEAANRWAHPEQYTDAATAFAGIKASATTELSRCWQLLDDNLKDSGPWLLGDKLSGADFHLFMIAWWSRRYDANALNWPQLKRHTDAMLERESVKRMIAQEGLVL
ncbi:glutathione S-transferase family protein [Marinobacterium jannaschii]|uniref:glutathione S-transferase family protein n=1 Tax=Marinobacterium jannaschii TaxID=64970 RepID=UPI000A07147A|nr:glutathione S-transferase family protein [Marinobacterium jannaschii]